MTYNSPPEDLMAKVCKTTRNKRLTYQVDMTVSKSSTLLYAYDDPDRAAFFIPLTILLVLHIFFLIHIYLYAPNPDNVFFK